jgi:two-component system chemotaxis response regulator CheB
MNSFKSLIHEKLKTASVAKVFGRQPKPVVKHPETKKDLSFETTDKIIAIGASTGGTNAISRLLSSLPVTMPGIVVVQHMPQGFTKSFAERLNEESRLYVQEANDNIQIKSSSVYIAPGGKHLKVKRSGAKYYTVVEDGEPVNRHKPSVDVLFNSVAESTGKNAVGVILTGMGNDGAEGMSSMKKAGSFNIAQDEASSIVFGMPKMAINAGGVDKVLSLEEISRYISYKLFKD